MRVKQRVILFATVEFLGSLLLLPEFPGRGTPEPFEVGRISPRPGGFEVIFVPVVVVLACVDS